MSLGRLGRGKKGVVCVIGKTRKGKEGCSLSH